jgi:superfamily I DNA/RNA helicase
MDLTAAQLALIEAEGSLFALGPAGTGKTTALQQRLLRLLARGESAYNLLVLVAEPERRQSFLAALHQSRPVPYAELSVLYYYELAREMTTLFWPLVARPAGFARPFQPPTFLSYDLAQLLMSQTIIAPMLNEGAFSDVRLRPQQIISQLLDTLNRAALNGFTLAEAVQRQVTTWAGESDFLRHLEEAAEAARRFRQHCLERSLLDLSLIVETFDRQIVHHPEFHRYFQERYRHLLVDNVEEQTPAGQNFIVNLMPFTASTTIVYDAGGGYKRFMAADPAGANRFRKLCEQTVEFDPAPSFTSSPAHRSSG